MSAVCSGARSPPGSTHNPPTESAHLTGSIVSVTALSCAS